MAVVCKELGFFVSHSVPQDASFELSKTSFGQFFIFFIIRGDPSDLGGVKISLSRFIVVLQSKLKMFCDQGVKYYTKTASGTPKITLDARWEFRPVHQYPKST